jgi:flagellin
MSLVINHNLMAMNAARNLGSIYSRLATSTERLSSGLRINSAGDDAAGLAIRELMRADIAVMWQGIRNASDGISLIQTAEGAMAVIDEKLTRMKELAEQAATGTYTTIQREIMNSEYIAMSNEIDRIANATEFNGIKMLDGSLSTFHGGQGMKIHFGTGNSAAEDYYFITIGDVRASTESGLKVGGDAKNDIWAQGGLGGAAGGCCGGGLTSLNSVLTGQSGNGFSYGYNWDDTQNVDANLDSPSYLAGLYRVSSGMTLQQLINSVNQGTQARVRLNFTSATGTFADIMGVSTSSGAVRVCLDDEVYYFGSASLSTVNGKENFALGSAAQASSALVARINSSSTSFWAIQSGANVFVFARQGGDRDTWLACDDGLGLATSATVLNRITWQNMETFATNNSGTSFGLGGERWATMNAAQRVAGDYGVTLNGRDVGSEMDLRILNVGSGAGFDLSMAGLGQLAGFDRSGFMEIQNAADGQWVGAHIRTQSHAQEALDAIQSAIERKDIVRANLGAYQNRLENTITNLSIMAENLQSSESRISDVDVAVEMTEFTRNNILAQAAVSMLGQANALPQLALSLLQ